MHLRGCEVLRRASIKASEGNWFHLCGENVSGCTDYLGAGAYRRHSRHKESIRTMKGMAIPAVPRYDDRSVCRTMWGGGRGWVR